MSAQDHCLRASTSQPALPGLVHRYSVAIGRLAAVVFWQWPERVRQRRQLASMDDRTLSDLGISRSDVDREFRKAPWH